MTVDNTTKHHPCAAALAAQMKLRGIPSQMQLTRDLEAAGLKTSQSTLSLALAGKTPDLSTASKLATFFDVPATTFMPELAVLVPQTAADTGLPRFPLERTRLAKHNERTHYVEEDIHILAADLRDRGLMQNLVGYLDGDVAEVYGGGRRWRALRLLALWGELPDDLQNHGIPFKLYDTRLECLQATVAENAQREDVHFLDRAAALARIREEGGLKAAKIARDLHLGERLVQQLLQIHDRLPDWARDRAFLPKDDPNHLKFRDCRDLVEETKAARDAHAPAGAPGLRQHNDEARRIIRRILAGGLDGDISDLALKMECAAAAGPILAQSETCDFLTPELWAHLQWFEEWTDLPPEQENGEEVPLPLTMPEPRFTKDEARAALDHMQSTAVPTPKGVSISDRLKDLLVAGGDFKRADLNAGTDVNWVAVVEDLNREFGTTITRDDARTVPTLGAMARYIIAGAADQVRLQAAPQPKPAAMPAHPVSATVAAPHFTDFNITALWPGGNRRPQELTLLDRSTGQKIVYVPAQRDIEDRDGGGANAVLQEMQRRGFNLYNAFAGTSGRIDSIVVMRTTDRSTTTYVPQHAAPGAGED